MITYLTHPQHGVHVAYTDFEVADCIKNGWSVRGENSPSPQSPVVSAETLHMKQAEAMPPHPILRMKRKYTKRKAR
jgi:hypothetical protein